MLSRPRITPTRDVLRFARDASTRDFSQIPTTARAESGTAFRNTTHHTSHGLRSLYGWIGEARLIPRPTRAGAQRRALLLSNTADATHRILPTALPTWGTSLPTAATKYVQYGTPCPMSSSHPC